MGIQDLSDQELLDAINAQSNRKNVSDLSDEELMRQLQNGQEASQNTKQIQTSKPTLTPEQKAVEMRKNGLIGKATINALPFLGGVGGAIVGGGAGSVPAAGLGAAAGEGLKQRLLGQQTGQPFDTQAVERAGMGGAIGQGIGLGAGRVFEGIMPQIGKMFPRIDKDVYRYITDVYKKGGAQSKNNWLVEDTLNHVRPLKPTHLEDTIGQLGSAELLAELLLHSHPGTGAGTAYLVKKLLESPIAHKQLLKAYGQSTRVPIGGGVGALLNDHPSPRPSQAGQRVQR